MGADTAAADVPALLERVRAECLALPEATERLSHGSPSFFVRKMFLTWVDDHHGDGNTGFWCAAPPGAQTALLAEDPERFFHPPYVGGRGWLGVRLVLASGRAPDWDEITELIEDAYRTVAPAKLVRALDER
ncbi:MmcQ/YjbR family DNA-binding protein [Streptomyces armeniacus]|uniref:MmcQ/YjbR family DNA-binding protein n=2 Tax=Streptomyces armeniacus TaxID=83291 RepID=A0A345Y0I7_9ACTN|nr:MmcQ/YjbR family DNA-binding protein [Streptomyces armeniacus]